MNTPQPSAGWGIRVVQLRLGCRITTAVQLIMVSNRRGTEEPLRSPPSHDLRKVSQRPRVIAICENPADLNLFFDRLGLAVDKVIHHHDVYAARVVGTRRDVASGDSYSSYDCFIKLDAEKREIAIAR